MRPRLLAGLSFAAGIVVIVAAQLASPGTTPPLYDGVVVTNPYRWVAPPAGQPGSPGAYTGTEPVQNGTSPAFVAATDETPPQAQLLVAQAAFAVPAGTTELHVEVTPLAPPTSGSIVGNAYSFSVTDATGAEVPLAAGTQVTIVLRAPAGTTGASLVQLVSGEWRAIPTVPAGAQDSLLATVDALGEFGIVGTLSPNGPSSVAITVAVIAVVGLGGLVSLWLVGRRASARSVPGRAARTRSRRRR